MRVLLSIKPKYVEQIEQSSKLFEFRKKNFKNKPSEIWIYASAPIKRIVGIIYVDDILEDSPKELWRQCKNYAGIEERPFFDYFRNKSKGIAIKIKKYERLDYPINPYEVNLNFTPPQSYAYLDNVFPKGLNLGAQGRVFDAN